MSSLVINLNSSTAQEIVNWVTTADGCVHTADETRLNSAVQSRRRRPCVLGFSRTEALRNASVLGAVAGIRHVYTNGAAVDPTDDDITHKCVG